MPGEITPTIRRWQLGQHLRQLREDSNVDPKDAAKEIGVSASSLSRIENGKQTIKPPYAKLLALLYGVDSQTRDELMEVAEEALRPEWYTALASRSPTWFRQYLGYESVASTIHIYESELVSGLLQTSAYTRAVIPAGRKHTTETDLEQAVELRRGRQERASQGGVALHVVLNEAVLRRHVGGIEVLRKQLCHITELSALPNVTVQVLMFEVGEHSSMTSGFTMLGFADHPGMNTVYLENGRGALYLEGKADLDQYAWRFGRLTDLALPPKKTRDLLVKVADDL